MDRAICNSSSNLQYFTLLPTDLSTKFPQVIVEIRLQVPLFSEVGSFVPVFAFPQGLIGTQFDSVVVLSVPCYGVGMKFTLLTHCREVDKRSNTGRLVLEVLGDVAEQTPWDRLNPPARLVEEISAGGVALIYPGLTEEDSVDLTDFSQFILIDGTWHEARRIYQRSPYLRKACRVSLKPNGTSQYNLRRNQKEDCLCTAECVIEILRCTGWNEQAERLRERFLAFIRPTGIMRGAGIGQ